MTPPNRHSALLVGLAVAIGTLLGGCRNEVAWPAVLQAIRTEYPDVRRLTTDSLAAWVETDSARRPVLLDVRTVDEFAVSHLAGARRIDPETEDFSALSELDLDTPIVTYCSIGFRSSDLAARLQADGFSDVQNLEGSIFRWANEGRPVYRDGREVRDVHPFDGVWGSLLNPRLRAEEPRNE